MLTINDTEFALIKENFFKQMEAKGYDQAKTNLYYFRLVSKEKHYISILFDLLRFRMEFIFTKDGTTQHMTLEFCDYFVEESHFYPNDTPEALVERLLTCSYHLLPNREDTENIGYNYFNGVENNHNKTIKYSTIQ